MASMDPSPDEISQVIEIANLDPQDDRTMVIQALKNNNRNVETVIMQYFDSADNFRRKYVSAWDDSLFHTDRDGNPNTSGVSFHIESLKDDDTIQGVTPPPENYAFTAPSRPPSRSNDRSPLGVTNPRSQEDDDMQRALRESAQEAGIAMPPQQSGVVDTDAPSAHFGPANRPDYTQGDWTMVPVGPTETQLSRAPEAALRKRTAEAPAFLVQGHSTAGDHSLGGLLTILHEIPLARNVLLESGEPAASYGFNSEWWKGKEILPPHILASLQAGELSWGQQDVAKPELEEEIHRLMAFLDSTERSYGTVSVLTDLITFSTIGAEKQFYEQLGMRNGDKLRPLSQVATLALVHGDDVGDEDAKFGLLEIEHLRSEYANIKTLYESLDHIMWSDVLAWNEVHDASKMAMFKEMGEVLAIKIGGDGPEDSIEIPVELYPERYLASRKEEARRIQLALCDTKNAIAKIDQEEHAINEWRNDWEQINSDKKGMIQRATSQWKTYQQYLQTLANFRGMEQSDFDTDKYPDYRTAPSQMGDREQHCQRNVELVLQLTERILSDMDEKMKNLNTQLEQIKAKQRFLGKLLTVPDKPGRENPLSCKRYILRGITSKSDVIYVCRRREPDLIDLDDEPKPLDQWWRLSYTAGEADPVKSEKMEVEQVLQDIWQETKTPLLIYATEESLRTPPAPLTGPLDRFIRADNKAFRQELNQEKPDTNEVKRAGLVDPISPSKRKHRSDSMDSMNSNRASLGSDEQNGFDNPFEDQEASGETELTDMSANTLDLIRSDGVEANLEYTGGPAVLDSQPPLYTENTSATLTPNTVMAEDTDTVPRGEEQITVPDGITTITSDATPEMQERSRPSAFIAVSPVAERAGFIDMDVPDHTQH